MVLDKNSRLPLLILHKRTPSTTFHNIKAKLRCRDDNLGVHLFQCQMSVLRCCRSTGTPPQ